MHACTGRYVSNTALSGFLQTLAEATGQPLSQADIDDVLALSDDGGGHGATVANIREAMLLQPNERHTRAEAKRSMRHPDPIPQASAGESGGDDGLAAAI